MKKIIAFSVQHPWIILSLSVLLTAGGLWGAMRLPLDAVPDITDTQVQILTYVEGLSPEQIEQQVTFPVEVAVSGIPRAEAVRSVTRPVLSQVTVSFEEGSDIYRCRQLVAERIQGLAGSLPEGVVPKLGPISTGLGEIYFYSLEARKVAKGAERDGKRSLPSAKAGGFGRAGQLMDLRELQDWVVKPRLLTVPGVAEVNTIGGYERQALVRPDPRRLAQRGLSLGELVAALERANRNVGGGVVEQGAEQFSVSAIGIFPDLEAIRRFPVGADESLSVITVGDVAEVEWGAGLRAGAGTVDGQEAVVCTAMMLAGANSREVSSRVDERLKEIAGSLPDWAVLNTLYNRTDLVNATLETVVHNLALGALLVVLVLVLTLGNWRAGLITAVTIPLSMLAAVLMMKQLGISGNLMSLGAIDFGILVDGSVIVLDHVVRLIGERRRRLGRELTSHELRETVLDGTIEVRSAAGFGQIIIIVAMLPLFGLTGVEGRTFTPMAATLALALAAAFVVSFCVTPALACLFLQTRTVDREPLVTRKAREFYEALLTRGMKVPGKLLVAGLALVALSALLYRNLGAVFMPQLDEGSIAIQLVRPATVSLSESVHFEEMSERLVLEFPEVTGMFARIGTSEIAFDACGSEIADTSVMLAPRSKWPKQANGRRRTKAELEVAISEKLEAEMPGQRFLMTQPIQLRFNELLEGTRAEVAIKVFGEDLEKISELTARIAAVVEKVPGAGDVEMELKGTAPALSIRPRHEVLATMGLSPSAVLDTVEIGIGGVSAGAIYRGARRFPVVVRTAEAYRQDLDLLKILPVGIGKGSTRPLGDLARLSFVPSYPDIRREQARRRAAVLVNPRGRDVESFVIAAKKAVAESVKLPDGYYLEWGGAFANLQKARDRLAVLTPLALALVLTMIYAAFRNAALALLVFACVPLALVGGVVALAIRGLPFSISAGVGFIALAGIAVLNGVVLVSTGLKLRERGLDPTQAIRESAVLRMRPVLMTALVEVFGFLPMMFSGGMGAEVQRPLASVVVGGVISSTLLTLLMLPSWQAWLEKHHGKNAALSAAELSRHLASH
jgi:cobalt-zinc-cadmium resistance protein CzcA